MIRRRDLTFNGVHLEDAGYALFAREALRGDVCRRPRAESESGIAWRRSRTRTGSSSAAIGRSTRFITPAIATRLTAISIFCRRCGLRHDGRQSRPAHLADRAAANRSPASRSTTPTCPPMPPVAETRGANEWMSPANELAAFKVDPRFEVNLFASEEQFPEIANPIQMRWDTRGRLWVSCSTTYPHVYPGTEPEDRS